MERPQLTSGQLEDIASFITWALIQEKPYGWILANVGHDVNGLLSNDPTFLPRTTGYTETLTGITRGG